MKSTFWLVGVIALLTGCDRGIEKWLCNFKGPAGQKPLTVDLDNQTLLIGGQGVPIRENGNTVFWQTQNSSGSFDRKTGKVFSRAEQVGSCSQLE